MNYSKATMSTRDHLYDVFLCHNGRDKRLVEVIAQRLEDEANLKPFLDKWHLVPGQPWQEDLEDALDASSTCAVFLGSKGLGPWENEEMRTALHERTTNKSLRVIPVLLPGAEAPSKGSLPKFLRRYSWVDFREGVQSQEAFRRLVAGISGTAPGRVKLNQTPPLPRQEEAVSWIIVLRASVDAIDETTIEAVTTQLRKLSGDASLTIRKVRKGSVIMVMESSAEALETISSLFVAGKLRRIAGISVISISKDEPSYEDAPHAFVTPITKSELNAEDKALWDLILQEIAEFGGEGQSSMPELDPRDVTIFLQEGQAARARILCKWPTPFVDQLVKWAFRHKSLGPSGKNASEFAERILTSYEISLGLPVKKEGSERGA